MGLDRRWRHRAARQSLFHGTFRTAQRVSDNFSIGVQYRYTRFETDGYTVRAGQGTPPSTTNPFVITPAGFTDIQRTNDVFDHHTVRATASFRF